MIHVLALLLATAAAQPAPADTPVGRWETVNRSDNTPAGTVRLFLHDGLLYGQIESIYDLTRRTLRCTSCDGDRHDQPFLGLQFLRGLHPGADAWDGGTVLDPDTGRTYKASLRVTDAGRRLVIRGYLGISLFGGSQTWKRVD